MPRKPHHHTGTCQCGAIRVALAFVKAHEAWAPLSPPLVPATVILFTQGALFAAAGLDFGPPDAVALGAILGNSLFVRRGPAFAAPGNAAIVRTT